MRKTNYSLLEKDVMDLIDELRTKGCLPQHRIYGASRFCYHLGCVEKIGLDKSKQYCKKHLKLNDGEENEPKEQAVSLHKETEEGI